MLETIREYAASQLGDSADAEQILRARSEYMLQLAEQSDLRGPDQLHWLELLDAEHDNIRAALTWALEHDDQTATRIAAVMWEYWWARGHLREGRDRLGRVIATSRPSLARAVAIFGEANLSRDLGDIEGSLRVFRELVPVFEALGDRMWLSGALLQAGTFEALGGDYATGRERVDRSIAIAREDRDDFMLGNALSNLGWLELESGHVADAVVHLEEAVAAWERAGNTWGVALAQSNLGCALVLLGEMDRAEQLLQRSVPALARLKMPWLVCAGLDELGIPVLLARGETHRATRLLGARDRLGHELGRLGTWYTDDDVVSDLRESLGADAFDAAYEEGRGMSLEEVVDCAVGSDRPRTSSDGAF